MKTIHVGPNQYKEILKCKEYDGELGTFYGMTVIEDGLLFERDNKQTIKYCDNQFLLKKNSWK